MDGIVPLLKPPGMTSSNAVFDMRRLFNEKRAGHLGTLDPGAAGVLPVCLGRTARLFDFLVDKEKTYRFECAFGTATDTQDSYGAVTERKEMRVEKDALEAVLPAFTGDILQQAPAYSALKSSGRKLYELALAGEEVPEKIRPVSISALKVLEQMAENRFLMEVSCSRGTYVRTICHDLGKALGGCAHMGLLIRTAAGPFRIENCLTVEELRARREEGTLLSALVSGEEALKVFPAVSIGEDRLVPVKNGLSSRVSPKLSGPVRLYCAGAFLGAGVVENGEVRLKVPLYY